MLHFYAIGAGWTAHIYADSWELALKECHNYGNLRSICRVMDDNSIKHEG